MKRLMILIFTSVLLIVIACTGEKDCCVLPSGENQLLEGSWWLLYESGYSPGVGYVTEEVPPNPPQTITFLSGNKMLSNAEGLSGYKFYRILDDEHSDDKILGIYEVNPGNSENPIPYDQSYNIKFKDGNLFLHYRYCIEGCHLAFKPIDN